MVRVLHSLLICLLVFNTSAPVYAMGDMTQQMDHVSYMDSDTDMHGDMVHSMPCCGDEPCSDDTTDCGMDCGAGHVLSMIPSRSAVFVVEDHDADLLNADSQLSSTYIPPLFKPPIQA